MGGGPGSSSVSGRRLKGIPPLDLHPASFLTEGCQFSHSNKEGGKVSKGKMDETFSEKKYDMFFCPACNESSNRQLLDLGFSSPQQNAQGS